MKVRAKFHCDSVTDFGSQRTVRLRPVTAYQGPSSEASDEDKGFFEATPSGSLEMSITHAGVQEFFTPGTAYYLDFEAAQAHDAR